MEQECIIPVTQCRGCGKVGAVKLLLPARKEQFPRECEVCGRREVRPAPAGLLDKMEAAFDAGIAQERAMAMEPVA